MAGMSNSIVFEKYRGVFTKHQHIGDENGKIVYSQGYIYQNNLCNELMM